MYLEDLEDKRAELDYQLNLSRVEAIKSDHEWQNRKQHHQISRILDKLILWELDHD